MGLTVIMDTILGNRLENVPLLHILYPTVYFCTPAQIFVPQVIKMYPKDC